MMTSNNSYTNAMNIKSDTNINKEIAMKNKLARLREIKKELQYRIENHNVENYQKEGTAFCHRFQWTRLG